VLKGARLQPRNNEIGEENKEAFARALDEKDARRIAPALEGKNAGCQDFKADEANGWCATTASSQARYWPRPSAIKAREYQLAAGTCVSVEEIAARGFAPVFEFILAVLILEVSPDPIWRTSPRLHLRRAATPDSMRSLAWRSG
jgi:hypothetical protein